MFYALWLKVRPWVRSGIQGGGSRWPESGKPGVVQEEGDLLVLNITSKFLFFPI